MSTILRTLPIVTKRRFDTGDPAVSAQEELQRIQKLNDHTAWYVNPMFTVRSESPDAAFFEEAHNRMGAFFGEMRRRLQNPWRANRLIDKSRLNWKEFSLNYDGVFLIHGELKESRDLNTIANEYLGDLLVTPTEGAAQSLKTQDFALFDDHLRQQREELESHVGLCWFLIPSCSIIAMERSPRFEAECRKQWQEWNRNIRRSLKDERITREFAANIRKLRFSSDPSIRIPAPHSERKNSFPAGNR